MTFFKKALDNSSVCAIIQELFRERAFIPLSQQASFSACNGISLFNFISSYLGV